MFFCHMSQMEMFPSATFGSSIRTTYMFVLVCTMSSAMCRQYILMCSVECRAWNHFHLRHWTRHASSYILLCRAWKRFHPCHHLAYFEHSHSTFSYSLTSPLPHFVVLLHSLGNGSGCNPPTHPLGTRHRRRQSFRKVNRLLCSLLAHSGHKVSRQKSTRKENQTGLNRSKPTRPDSCKEKTRRFTQIGMYHLSALLEYSSLSILTHARRLHTPPHHFKRRSQLCSPSIDSFKTPIIIQTTCTTSHRYGFFPIPINFSTTHPSLPFHKCTPTRNKAYPQMRTTQRSRRELLCSYLFSHDEEYEHSFPSLASRCYRQRIS